MPRTGLRARPNFWGRATLKAASCEDHGALLGVVPVEVTGTHQHASAERQQHVNSTGQSKAQGHASKLKTGKTSALEISACCSLTPSQRLASATGFVLQHLRVAKLRRPRRRNASRKLHIARLEEIQRQLLKIRGNPATPTSLTSRIPLKQNAQILSAGGTAYPPRIQT